MTWLRAWWARWFAAPDPCDVDLDYLGTMPVPEDLRVPGEVTQALNKEK